MKWLSAVLLTVVVVCVFSSSCAANALVEKTRAQLGVVKDYTCDLTLNAKLPQISVSDMKMTLYYKRPNKVHIEAKEGFAMLPEEGLYIGDPVEEAMSKFNLVYLADVLWQGRKCAKYALRAKSDAIPPMANARVYIDRMTATPAGFTGTSVRFGNISTTFRYEKLQGKYWLPVVTTFTIRNMKLPRTTKPNQPTGGVARVEYTGYRVNTGLKDSLFKSPPKSVSKMRKYRKQ